jgi:hypothetical protein
MFPLTIERIPEADEALRPAIREFIAREMPPLDAGPTRCRDNTDCNNDEFGNRICDTASGRCVACTATRFREQLGIER